MALSAPDQEIKDFLESHPRPQIPRLAGPAYAPALRSGKRRI